MPSILTALLTTAAVAALTLMARSVVPSVRWARQLERDIAILGGLDAGSERERWSASVDRLARRLRKYREETPRWDKVIPVLAFVGLVVSVLTFGFTELGRRVFMNEAPLMVPLAIVAVLATAYFVIQFVRGRDSSQAW